MDFGKLPNAIIHQQLAPQVIPGGPINDIQLIALVASRRNEEEPANAVAWAVEVVLEAILQAGAGKLQAMLNQRLREQSALEE
jgi:hypothetical protein